MLNIVLTALPLLSNLIPQGRADDLIAAGSRVAQEVFGSTKEDVIAEKLQNDPALGEQFKAKLIASTSALQIESRNLELRLQDTANARAANQAVIDSGSKLAWSGPVIDVVVTVGFFGTLAMLLLRPVQLSPEMLTLLTTMVGFLGNNFAQIVNYHRGSSAGSAIKDRLIQAFSNDNQRVAASAIEVARKVAA